MFVGRLGGETVVGEKFDTSGRPEYWLPESMRDIAEWSAFCFFAGGERCRCCLRLGRGELVLFCLERGDHGLVCEVDAAVKVVEVVVRVIQGHSSLLLIAKRVE